MADGRGAIRRRALGAVGGWSLLLAALVGCGDDGDSTLPVAPTDTTEATSAVRTDSSSQVVTGGPLPKNQALDLEQRHPNGTTLRVTNVSFAATSTSLSIEAVNGFTEAIKLNNRGIHLVDNLGNRYNFAEPQQNAELEVMSGATLSGTLTFLGPIDRRATALRLVVNVYRDDDTVDMSARYDRTNNPDFQIDDIPVKRS